MARMVSMPAIALVLASTVSLSAATHPFHPTLAMDGSKRFLQASTGFGSSGLPLKHENFCDAELTKIGRNLTGACCVNKANCPNGAPKRCDAKCADTYLPFYKVCSKYIDFKFPTW